MSALPMPGAVEVHAARIVDRGDLFWFASLDGQAWIEVSDDPRLVSIAELEQLINPSGCKTLRMRIARRFLASHGAVFLTGETHE